MKIQTSKFKAALDAVKPGLAVKEMIEQTSYFVFLNGNVYTYNDALCISHRIEGLDFEGAISSDELLKFLSKTKAEELEIVIFNNEQVIIHASKSKLGLPLVTKITLPIDDEQLQEKGKWKELPENFAEAVDFVSESATSNMEDIKYACVHINKDGFVEATDNHRIAHWKFKQSLEINSVLIPVSSIKTVVKIKPIKIAKGNGWTHFKNNSGCTLACRSINEKFMDTSAWIKEPKGKAVELEVPKKLHEAISRAMVVAEREQKSDETVTIKVKNNKLIISAASDSGSWFEESMKVAFDGVEFSFMITPYLLQSILKETLTCKIFEDRMIFKKKNWVYVTTLKY